MVRVTQFVCVLVGTCPGWYKVSTEEVMLGVRVLPCAFIANVVSETPVN